MVQLNYETGEGDANVAAKSEIKADVDVNEGAGVDADCDVVDTNRYHSVLP